MNKNEEINAQLNETAEIGEAFNKQSANKLPDNIFIRAKNGDAIVMEAVSSTEYTKLNYIESNGSQYIDTGVTPNTAASFHSVARIYSCKIYDNGVLIRNYIP